MTIYDFMNYIYINYNTVFLKQGNCIKIAYDEKASKVLRRAIGEEISDFQKKYDKQQW